MLFNRNLLGKIGNHLFPSRDTCTRVLHQIRTREWHETPINEVPISHRSPNNQHPYHNKKLQKEAYYRDKLAQTLHGETEVQTPDGGRIDIVTQYAIIEVKYVKKWKSALGQITAYGHYYPKHQKQIHLFGEKGSVNSGHIERICRASGVIVTWEDDM